MEKMQARKIKQKFPITRPLLWLQPLHQSNTVWNFKRDELFIYVDLTFFWPNMWHCALLTHLGYALSAVTVVFLRLSAHWHCSRKHSPHPPLPYVTGADCSALSLNGQCHDCRSLIPESTVLTFTQYCFSTAQMSSWLPLYCTSVCNMNGESLHK